jgi:hypothetical protein
VQKQPLNPSQKSGPEQTNQQQAKLTDKHFSKQSGIAFDYKHICSNQGIPP